MCHSRHGDQAVAEWERVSWQDGCYETGEQTGDAGGRIRRSTRDVAEGGAFGTGDEMRSDWGGVRPSQKNQTCGQKARSTPMISAEPEIQRECQHLRSRDRSPTSEGERAYSTLRRRA